MDNEIGKKEKIIHLELRRARREVRKNKEKRRGEANREKRRKGEKTIYKNKAFLFKVLKIKRKGKFGVCFKKRRRRESACGTPLEREK